MEPHFVHKMKAPSEDRLIEPIAWQKGHAGKYWPTSLTRSFPGTASETVESWPSLGWSRLVRSLDYSCSIDLLILEGVTTQCSLFSEAARRTSLLGLVVCMTAASSATHVRSLASGLAETCRSLSHSAALFVRPSQRLKINVPPRSNRFAIRPLNNLMRTSRPEGRLRATSTVQDKQKSIWNLQQQ